MLDQPPKSPILEDFEAAPNLPYQETLEQNRFGSPPLVGRRGAVRNSNTIQQYLLKRPTFFT